VPEDLNAAVAFDLFGPRFKFVTAVTKDTNIASILNEYSSSAKNAQKYIEIIIIFFALPIPYSEFYEEGLMMVTWPKHVVIKVKENNILLCF